MDQHPSVARKVATATNAGCVINEEWIDSTAVISASGVLDMLTSPQLAARISAARDQKPTAIIVDLTDVEFLASAAMGVLVAAREQVSGNSGFVVVADGPATSRPLILVGLADAIGMRATLAEALAALEE